MTSATPTLAPAHTLSAARGRLLILLAAVMWSTSGAFTNFLREPTVLGLNEPKLSPLQIAAARALFAGLVLAGLLRRRDLSFRPATAWTAASFAAMNTMFIAAMSLGSAANAILLQYTAPLWLFLAGICFLREPADRRGVVSLVIGLAGIGVIVAGVLTGSEAGGGNQWQTILLGLGSGATYAGVILGLRAQRGASTIWLTVVNHLFGGLVLLPFVWWQGFPGPSLPQLGWLALFGVFQMGLPYALMARGLRSVCSQEAGALTLLEPLLNPVWAYLVAPDKEKPTPYIFLGGAFILGALAYRYWPGKNVGQACQPDASTPSDWKA